MHININKKRLVQLISTSLQPTEVKIPRSYVWFIQDGITVHFGKDDGEAYKAAQKILLDCDELTSRYSAKTITSGFRSLLVQFLTEKEGEIPTEEEIKKELNAWLTKMVTAEEFECTYFVVIENLKLHREVTIGQVKLEPLTEEMAQELSERISDRAKEEVISQFSPHHNGRASLASIKLSVRDIKKEFETANQRFQEILHVLRFLGGFVYTKGHRAYIDFRGELARGHSAYLVLLDDQRWSFNESVVGYLWEFEITGKNLKSFKELGLDTFSEILSKPVKEQNELERRLIHSITWISRSTLDPPDFEQFILLCIALENLLGGDQKEGLTRVLAERLAFLLEDTCEKRIEIFENALEILRIRGQVVHTGQPKEEKKLLEYLPLLYGYVSWAVIRVAELMRENNWDKFDNIANHFTTLKFAEHQAREKSA